MSDIAAQSWSSAGLAYGFHSANHRNDYVINPERNDHIWVNLTTFLSWIPLLCTISAVYHNKRADEFENAAKNRTEKKEIDALNDYAATLRGRAKIEYCQVLFILPLVLDLIATFGRYCPCCQPEDMKAF